MGRTLCVGDIHGGHKALLQVLERSGFDNSTDRLISLGDICDGWPETPECVQTLLGIRDLVALSGNHCLWSQDWFNYGDKPMLWLSNGGDTTIDAYMRAGLKDDPEHKDFWNSQVDWYHDTDTNNMYIHAGWAYRDYDNFRDAASAPVKASRHSKECHWDRTLITGAFSANAVGNSFKATREFNRVFIGHTSTRRPEPLKLGNLWNLDTGGGWDGKLTIMDVDTEEYWQSDFVKDLYPGVKGR